jgi:hypothetical protein
MNEPRSPTNRNRCLSTKENFVLRMKKLLCDLAIQAGTIREQSSQTDTSPPGGQKPPTMGLKPRTAILEVIWLSCIFTRQEVGCEPRIVGCFLFAELPKAPEPRHLMFDKRWYTLLHDQPIALLEG